MVNALDIFVETYASVPLSSRASMEARPRNMRAINTLSAPVAAASSLAPMGTSLSMRRVNIPRSIAIHINAVVKQARDVRIHGNRGGRQK